MNEVSSRIATSALFIALIVVFAHLFQGMLNGINALVIPIAIGIVFVRLKNKDRTLFVLALILTLGFLRPRQLVFMVAYLIIGRFLLQLEAPSLQNRKRTGAHVLVLTLLSMPLYLGSIVLTDLILGTNIFQISMTVFGGAFLKYGSVLLLQSFMISAAQVFLWKRIVKTNVILYKNV
ncbi:MAG TPA: hypothetical protein DHN33_04335 [Eubacteriaceae bacterium]|nr:hypothetical protein [Eubacteriaceae bacterium]